MLQLVLKIADLGHLSHPLPLHKVHSILLQAKGHPFRGSKQWGGAATRPLQRSGAACGSAAKHRQALTTVKDGDMEMHYVKCP